jgi:DNA-binding phage protein
MRDLAEAMSLTDPRERAKASSALIDEMQEGINELSRVRREAIEELLGGGMTQTAVARELGMSRSRISQVLSAGSRPERAFLGSGHLAVAIGAKQESNRPDPGHVISAESFGAFEILSDLGRSVGLDASYEMVVPPGLVHLNRSNLIVLTNPRLLPFLAQVMEADPHIRYLFDSGDGWYLRDETTQKDYKSPRDRGEAADYGYLGRLPRPDGKGTFLYLAGTHAQGTLGAAHYVAANLADLYRELKTRRFSTIIECTFDESDPRKILSAERVTPLYEAS